MQPAASTMTVTEILTRGVALTTGEALAVTQSLLENTSDDEARPPFGLPSPQNIVLHVDGRVTSSASAVTPTALEVAMLLDRLLPGQAHVPGALRYALGRALHEVAAPPYDSLQAFSQTLRRFETGVRTEVVRGLVARAANQQLSPSNAKGAVSMQFAAAVLAGLALIGAGETMHFSRDRLPAAPASQRAAAGPLPGRPILITPQPIVVPTPSSSLLTAGRSAATHRATARSRTVRVEPQRSKRFPSLSRLLPRFRIVFEEL